ncbi:MAG: LysM domain-containing protein [Lachnospiraceae bacterium]
MEREFPKNVRQIGNVSDSPKVFIEDYADTFLNQLCDKAEQEILGAFLIGNIVYEAEQDSVYISGAIQMKQVAAMGSDIAIEDEVWKVACEEREEYFPEQEIVGWFLSVPAQQFRFTEQLTQMHTKYFTKKNTVLYMKNQLDQEELLCAYKFHDLMEIGGHYIYYEKNPTMQNYMLAMRKQIGVTPSEVVEDRAAKNFRSIISEKMIQHESKQTSKLAYVSSTFLVLVILVIGVTTINNYDKMQSVQSSLDHIADTVSKKDTNVQAKETNGTIVEVPKGDVTEQEIADLETGKPESKETMEVNPQEQGEIQLPPEKAESQEEKSGSTVQEMSKNIYIVKQGDTLAKISRKSYGDLAHVDAICRMNGLQDGNLIYIGQKLLLP